MNEGSNTGTELPRFWASKNYIGAPRKPVLKVEKVEMPQPNGVHFYLCLSGMLDPAALNRKVVSKFIQNVYIFSSSFYKHHKIVKKSLFWKFWWPWEGPVVFCGGCKESPAYLELVYLVTALVPSETACLASSPGRRSLTAVWISREVMVDLLL